MGINKFLLKHGPGSVGDNAKVLCLFYNQIKSQHPDWSKDEIFVEVLRRRFTPPYTTVRGLPAPSDEALRDLAKAADGKLSKLIIDLTYQERDWRRITADAGYAIHEVVHELVADRTDGDK